MTNLLCFVNENYAILTCIGGTHDGCFVDTFCSSRMAGKLVKTKERLYFCYGIYIGVIGKETFKRLNCTLL